MLMAFDRRGWGRRGGLKPAAHTPRVPGGEWHDLATHLHATAAKAKARADKFGAGDLAYLAGLIHDYGKFNPAFQKYLRDAVAGRSAKSVQHAVHGALLARDSGVPWVMQPIYGHHSQMPSGNDIKEAFANPETLQAYEKVRIAAEASGWKFNPPSSLDHPDFDLRGEMLLRMVFSCLVDSDYIDTEKHFDPERSKARTLGPSPSSFRSFWHRRRRSCSARQARSTRHAVRSTSTPWKWRRWREGSSGSALQRALARQEAP